MERGKRGDEERKKGEVEKEEKREMERGKRGDGERRKGEMEKGRASQEGGEARRGAWQGSCALAAWRGGAHEGPPRGGGLGSGPAPHPLSRCPRSLPALGRSSERAARLRASCKSRAAGQGAHRPVRPGTEATQGCVAWGHR